MKKLLIALVFISLSLFAAEKQILKVAVPQIPNGFIEVNSYEKVLNCTFPKEQYQLDITRLPVLRLANSYKRFDVYFPSFKDEKVTQLTPFYIENVVKIKAFPQKNNRIGIVFGSPEHHYLARRGMNFDYYSKSYTGILKGFELSRADTVVIPYQYEAMIEKKHYISDSYLVEAALGYNPEFSKVKLNPEIIKSRLHICLQKVKITINLNHKKTILKNIDHLIKSLDLFTALDYPIVQNAKAKEKDWLTKDSKTVKYFLNSIYSKNLKQLQTNHPFIQEAIIMDKKGSLLGTIYKTEDFDQSDEKKFQILSELTNEVLEKNIGDIYFDVSRKNFLLEFFYPVRKNNQLIGGLYLGIDPMLLLNEE